MDFLGMMGVIVDNRHSSHYSLFLKTTVRSSENLQAGNSCIQVYPQLQHHCQGRQRIVYIVLPRNPQGYPSHMLSPNHQVIGRPGKFIISNILRRVIAVRSLSEGYHPAFFLTHNLLRTVNSAVNHQKSPIGKAFYKLSKGMADILDILKEIQMVLLNI